MTTDMFAPVFLLVLFGFVLLNVVKLHVFTFLVPCCYVRYDFRVKSMFSSSQLPFVILGIYVLITFFVFIYLYWCLTRCSCQMMFVSFNSNTTGVTSGTGTTYLSGAPPVLVGFVLFDLQYFVDRCLSFFCLPLCCLSLFDFRILITLMVSLNLSD